MWDAWKAGDRKAALAAIPDSLVDELIVHGSPRRLPGDDPGVLRQRRDHDIAGDPAAGPGSEALGRGAVAWRRLPEPARSCGLCGCWRSRMSVVLGGESVALAASWRRMAAM